MLHDSLPGVWPGQGPQELVGRVLTEGLSKSERWLSLRGGRRGAVLTQPQLTPWVTPAVDSMAGSWPTLRASSMKRFPQIGFLEPGTC